MFLSSSTAIDCEVGTETSYEKPDELNIEDQKSNRNGKDNAITRKLLTTNFTPIRTRQGVEIQYANELCCYYCPMFFSSIAGKERHERFHNGKRPFSCEYCLASFQRKSFLKRHKVRCRSICAENITWCSFCDDFFKTTSGMVKHYDRIHGLKYDLKTNRFSVKQISELQKSENFSHKIDSFSCKFCGIRFESEILLRNHKLELHKMKLKNNKLTTTNSKDLFFHRGPDPDQCSKKQENDAYHNSEIEIGEIIENLSTSVKSELPIEDEVPKNDEKDDSIN